VFIKLIEKVISGYYLQHFVTTSIPSNI